MGHGAGNLCKPIGRVLSMINKGENMFSEKNLEEFGPLVIGVVLLGAAFFGKNVMGAESVAGTVFLAGLAFGIPIKLRIERKNQDNVIALK